MQQAGGLTINSPIYSLTAHHAPVQVLDVEMARFFLLLSHFAQLTLLTKKSMDPDESGVQPLQTSSYPPPALVIQYQHTDIESKLPNTLDRDHESRYSDKMQPVIDVASPASSIFTVPPGKHKSEEQPSTRPSTPTDSNSNAMVLSSPVNSFSQIPTPPPKRRVFFGPRSGCDKCRLGVKGHFIHSE